MILRLSDSLSRGLIVAIALAGGLVVSFFGVRTAIASYESEGDTATGLETAARLEPNNFAYWYLLGRYQQYNLEQPDATLAEISYKRAIALNPYATDAWLDLATAYELDGEAKQARQAYMEAKKSYPGSADVSWRYGNFLLRQGDQGDAYAELRRAIDVDPLRAPAAFSRAYRTNPDIQDLLERLLPAKQDVYVGVIWEALSAGQLAVAKTVWARLMTVHPQLQMRDVNHLVETLLQARDYSEARQVWDQGTATMRLPALFQPQTSVVWDPSFESGMRGQAFSWHYRALDQGVSAGLDRSEELSGKQSLRLVFDGRHNPELEIACALGVVQASTTYRFSGWLKTKELTGDQGIEFHLRSIEDSGTSTTWKSRQAIGTNPWTLFEQKLTTGPNVHQVQICVIREASANTDAHISGTAWIDDVNLLPDSSEHGKP